MTTPAPKKRRGLAAVSPERRRQIAQKGARALHKKKLAHQFTSEEASAAATQRHEDARLVTNTDADTPEGNHNASETI